MMLSIGVLVVLAVAAIYVGTIEAAFSALMAIANALICLAFGMFIV